MRLVTGIGGAPTHNILKCSKSDFERVLAVNAVGPFLGTKHAARVMIPARRGAIIATSSLAGVVSGAASHAYTCAKSAVAALTRNAAAELGRHGVRVNCVSPAALATPLAERYVGLRGADFEAAMESAAVLKGVRLRPDDVANAVLFLASDDARFVSGLNLVIDGAFSVVNPSFDLFNDGENPA